MDENVGSSPTPTTIFYKKLTTNGLHSILTVMSKTKTYLVAGVNWVAEVDLENEDSFPPELVKNEVATRAVEALFKKRHDIHIEYHEPITLTEEQRNESQLRATLLDMLKEEIVPGCGVGLLLCIMDNKDPETWKTGEEHEWYISSKEVLKNVGIPSLVSKFDEKYPLKTSETV